MTPSASNPLPADTSQTSHSIWRSGSIGRARLFFAAALCFALFYWTGGQFHIPPYAGHTASLLQQNSPIVALLMTAVMLALCVLIGTLIGGPVRADAGLMAGAFGLIALSYRGWPMKYVLFGAAGPSVYLLLALESALLLAMLILAWWIIRRQLLRGAAGAADPVLSPDTEDDTLNQRLLACAMQTVIMILTMLVLARSDAKLQALASAGVAAWLGTVGAYVLFPVRPSIWYWIGPGLVAIVGYVFAWFGASDEWRIGVAAGPLARALPLDYLGAGVVGALLGYWTSRKWQHHRETERSAGSTGVSTAARM